MTTIPSKQTKVFKKLLCIRNEKFPFITCNEPSKTSLFKDPTVLKLIDEKEIGIFNVMYFWVKEVIIKTPVTIM
jgi:hypothetical protein